MSDDLVSRVRQGEPRAVARALTIVERGGADAERLVSRLFPFTGRALVVGVTGAPGAGKSSLVDRLTAVARAQGREVGVLAVDPSSPFSGGAILGDRVRMLGHHADPHVFIRSMATRGQMGGLSRASADAVTVLDAAGKDLVIIETVGVGQDEVDVARTADVTVVVLVPEGGDDIQAIKAGVMEIADVFVVNKADREGADRLVHAIAAAESLRPAAEGEWRPPVLRTEATRGTGVAEVWDAIVLCAARQREGGAVRRRTRHDSRFREVLDQRWRQHVERTLPPGEFTRLLEAIEARRLDPYAAADAVLARLLPGGGAPGAPPDAAAPSGGGR